MFGFWHNESTSVWPGEGGLGNKRLWAVDV